MINSAQVGTTDETLTRDLCDEAALAPSGSDGVLWAPYLMGERTPHLDPAARAALVGLNAKHGRSHIIRAILEGVAFSLRDTFTIFDEMKVPVREIRLGGGGARASLWRQIQADVYGQTVSTVKAEEGAAYGAAILAGVGAGMWTDVESACREVVQINQRCEPNPADAKTHGRAIRDVPQDLSGVVANRKGRPESRDEVGIRNLEKEMGPARTGPIFTAGGSLVVTMHLPAQVLAARLVKRRTGGGEVSRDVMFEPVLADVMEQVLHVWNLHHASAAEGLQRIVGELALPT